MEDLAHFIQSMNEKYGLLDADNEGSGEIHDVTGSKQITECSSSAASNSCGNEVCSGQASSWKYLSVFVNGHTLDTRASLGSKNLHQTPVSFQSRNDSHLQAYARMIDINKESEPESPLPTTSCVVMKQVDSDDMFAEGNSLAELRQSAHSGEDFSNIVTMSDYIQSVYGSKDDGGRELGPTDPGISDDPCQLQTLSCNISDTSSGDNSSSPLQNNHKGEEHRHLRDVDDCSHSGVSSCRSDNLEVETLNSSTVAEDGEEQHRDRCPTAGIGDEKCHSDSWNSARAESQPKYEKPCIRKPTSTRSTNKSSAGASEHAKDYSRCQVGVVSRFINLDDEADIGEHAAMHEYPVPSGVSSSRSCSIRGGGNDTDCHTVHDDRKTSHIKRLKDEYYDHQLANISSDAKHDEGEGDGVSWCRPLSKGRQTRHNYISSLEEEEKGSGSSHVRCDKLAETSEYGNSIDEAQAQEPELGNGLELVETNFSSGFGPGKTGQDDYLILGEQQSIRRTDHVHNRKHEVGTVHTEGNLRLTGLEQSYGVSVQDSQETETLKASLNQNRKLAGTQQRLEDSMKIVKQREQNGGQYGGSTTDLGGQEQRISIHDSSHLLADIHQNVLGQGEQERQPRGLSSSGVFNHAQGVREDGRLKEQRTGRGGHSNCRINTSEYFSDNPGEQETESPGVPRDRNASHVGNPDKLETFKRGEPGSKRTKNEEKKYLLDSADNCLHRENVEDILSSIQALSNSVMHDRRSLIDNATKKLIEDTEVSSFPFDLKERAQGSTENSLSEASSGNARTYNGFPYRAEEVQPNLESSTTSRLKNDNLDNRKSQTTGSLILPTTDISGSYRMDDARFLESWDLDEDFNLSSSATWESESTKSKWIYINKLLCDNGFSPVNNSCMTPTSETVEKLFHILEELVQNYSRREKLVQELLAERDSLRQEEERSDQLTLKLETEVETLKQKLAASEQRAELAAAASEKTFAALRKEHQRLESTHASALQRCSQLEHVCRAKERSIRKLQEKIQEAVRKEQSQRSKDKELYEKLKHKVAISQKAQGEIIESNFLLRDLKPSSIVGIYERQRTISDAEINQLRDENSRLRKELREKENSLLCKATATVDADQAELDQREQDLIEQLTEVLETQQIEKQLKKKVTQCRQLEFKEDSALLPLAVNQTDDSKKENVNYQKPLKPESSGINSSTLLLQRLQLDVAQERRNNQLLEEIATKKLEYSTTSSTSQTSIVNGRTNGGYQEILQEVCTKLKVTSPHSIIDAVDGLLKVVRAVPRMETFIDNVCEVVYNEGCMFLARNDSEVGQSPEAVPGVLKFWLQKLQSTVELQQFKDSVCTQLWERYEDKAEKHPMSCKLAAASVKDLINIEKQYLLSQESYREAKSLMKAEPQKLLHRIIGHFQMLFEIPRLEGVMAVMNSVYIQISEYHNFARALCSMLGLPKDSGANTIISTVTAILNKVSNLY